MIACTQPRKIAARTLAERVAAEYGCKIGEEVGYIASVNDIRMGEKTKMVFLTDRALLDKLKCKEDTAKFSHVIIDEAHERSLFTDLLLTF